MTWPQGLKRVIPCFQENPRVEPMRCPYRKPTQVGEEKILRRLRELWSRNSAICLRNFGRRRARNGEGTCSRSCFGSKSLHRSGPTFFRSYGGKLQSSLTRVLSSALGFSPRPPESVCGTGTSLAPRGDFLGSMGSRTSGLAASSSPLGVMASPFNRMRPAYGLEPPQPSGGCATLLRPPSLQRQRGGTGILTCHPSSTPFGLDLGSD